MANTTITPNMGLPNPVPGVDSGPDYANNIQSSLNILDQHNHSPPNGGVQINPSGININSPLAFNNQQATGMQAVLFTNQPSLSTLNALYTVGGELFYNDAVGPIQITLSGNVNASSSGISDGSGNSAAFSTGVLVVQNSSTAPDSVQCGSILIGNTGTPSSGYVTISPPASTTSYNLTLPTIPSVSSFAQIDTSGNISASIPLANGITRSNQAAVGQQISSSCGAFTVNTGTPTAVTNLSVTISTSGRPVFITMMSDGLGGSSQIGGFSGVLVGAFIARNSTLISEYSVGTGVVIPPSSVFLLDPVSAGTYTYSISINSSGGTGFLSNSVLVAWEL